ncbi:ABC transporter substrate-binding protein [Granulicatella sp. zg-ZJ]|uniref:ABC transporter substrate-binding protein n=1 Tax=Granulicatella sp. zg-ZJ TaxID=2678504 RepID=UPI0013D6E513|nr:ABC transporter substrate-binding protein [Granulicatella sp. zg-ZJ]NEW62406.1 ABC transporter substrate-binding protein [Granulicatella sp. zg-ZJ]
MKKDAKFSNGDDVKAQDLATCLNDIIANNKLSRASAGEIKYEATGEYTLKATTERPTKDLKSILGEWTNVVYKKDNNGKYIFTGPFIIKTLQPKNELTLQPNKYYPESDKRPDTVIVKAFKDINTLKLAFESGEVDLAFGITGEIAKELKEKNKHILDFNAGYQYFTFLNTKNEILSDVKVREALDYAINRESIKEALFGGTLPTGLFAHYNAFDTTEKALYDTQKASQLLDEAGWKLESNSKYRQKDGKELALTIKTYSAKADLPKVSQIIASELEKSGIKTNVEVVDNISEVTKSREFDAVVYAQHPSPAGSPVYFLNQFFRTDAPNNFTSYSSVKTNELLDAMGTESDTSKLYDLAKQVQKEVLKDRPVLLTMDPQWHAAVSDNLKNYKLWNGDYYIVNSSLKVK